MMYMTQEQKPIERWEPIPGMDYAVSSFGNIWSFKSNRMLLGKVRKGYRSVHLCDSLGKKWVLVHRLVAQSFVKGETDKRWSVNHLDGNKLNNYSDNLQWTSSDEQNSHATNTGLRPIGDLVSTAKLTEEMVREVYQNRGTIRQSDLAARYGVSQAQISAIRCGRSWSHVTGAKRIGCRSRSSHVDPPDLGCQWSLIDGYVGYCVSDTGLVWSSKSNRLLSTGKPGKRGYVSVNLCRNGIAKKFLVHRLVAEEFVSGRSDKAWSVNHLDMDKSNNHATNLEWCSNEGQQEHKTRMMAGGHVVGKDNTKRTYLHKHGLT